jgi:hypothetical protein
MRVRPHWTALCRSHGHAISMITLIRKEGKLKR